MKEKVYVTKLGCLCTNCHERVMHISRICTQNPVEENYLLFFCQLLKRLYRLHLKWPQCVPHKLGRLIIHNSSCTIWAIWQRFFLLHRQWSLCISYEVTCTFCYLSHTWPVTQIAHSVLLSFSLFPSTYSQAVVEWIHNPTW